MAIDFDAVRKKADEIYGTRQQDIARRAEEKKIDFDAIRKRAAERYGTEQKEAAPRKANLLDLTVGSVKRGYDSSRKGQEAYKQMMGRENELKKYTDKLEGEEYNFQAEGALAQGVSGAAEMLGQQLRQWTDKRSLSAAGGAAALAAAAGQAGPQVLVPEEVLTVPAAFAMGMKAGSMASNFEIEAGNAYLEMRENGISEDTAKKIALVVGGGNAALEAVQLDELFKSFKVLDKLGVDDTALDKVKKVLVDRGVDVAKETAQEVAQEGVTVAGSQVASKIENGDWQYNAQEVGKRLGDTALSSALTFGVMNVPGGVRNVSTALQNRNTTRQPAVETQHTEIVTERTGPGAERNDSVAEQQGQKAEQETPLRGLSLPALEDAEQPAQVGQEEPLRGLSLPALEDTERPGQVEQEMPLKGLSLPTLEDAEQKAPGAESGVELVTRAASAMGDNRGRAVQAKHFGERSGLVKDQSWTQAHLSSRDSRALDALGKALGVEVRFRPTVAEGQANAAYENGVISLALDADDPVMTSVIHEAVHRLREMDPDAYGTLTELVQGGMSQEATRFNMEQRAGLYGTQDRDRLTEEMVADAFGVMLGGRGTLEQLVRDDRSVAEKLLDVVRDIINAVKRALGRQKELSWNQREAFQDLQARLGAMEQGFLDALKRVESAGEREYNEDRDVPRLSLPTLEDDISGRNPLLDLVRPRAEVSDVNDIPPLSLPRIEDEQELADRNDNKGGPQYGREEETGNQNNSGRVREFHAEAERRGQTVRTFEKTEGKRTGQRLGRFTEIAGDAISKTAASIQWELSTLGIESFVHAGDLEMLTKKGEIVNGGDAAVVNHSVVGISNKIDMDPKEVAGHEAYHFWKGSIMRDDYSDAVLSVLNWASDGFQELHDQINSDYFDGQYDMLDEQHQRIYLEELVAYISGRLHNGEDMSGMLTDAVAVRAAWNQLAEEQRGLEYPKPLSLPRVTEYGEENADGGKYSLKYREQLDEYVEKYGAIPKGERPAREIVMPNRTAKDRKLSQTVRTVMEAAATPETILPDIEQLAAEGAFSFESYSDKQAIQDAADKIGGEHGVGWNRAQRDWFDEMKKGKVSKELTTLGWTLYNNAANNGDTQLALDILDQMVRHQRNAAQALQATRILKKLSPETQLYQVQRSVNNLQEEINQRYGDKKGSVLKVDGDLAEQLLQAGTQEERDEILKDIYRDIGKQIPSRFVDKWNAWRYLAMLGNPRTHVRNIFGNLGFVPVVAAKNLTATGIEAAVSRVSGGTLNRTKGAVGLGKQDRALLKAAWDDYAGVADATMSGGKYDDLANANKYIDEGRVIFKTKPLEAVRKKNSALLEKEDVWFSQPHYAAAMAQYCKANGITAEQLAKGEGLDKARAYAVKEAQKATYRDANTFSKFVSELGRKADSNAVAKTANVALEGILPFRKTPANILVRGVEYSPIGLMKSLTHDLYQVKKGEMTGAEAIDNISAGLTGSMLLGLGVYLAAQGLVRGSGEGDDKEKKFDELQGHQTYSMELGDTSITLDWLAPECLPFFVGVNLWEQSRGEQATFSDWMDAIKQVGEPMLEMSCLQSLNDAFDSMASAVTYGGSDGLMAFAISAATSYITQGIPTLGGQIERSTQADRMTTYTNKDSWIPTDAQYVLGRASSWLPGDYNQIPYIDAWGRRDAEDSVAVRVRDNMVNPAYVSKMQESRMERELERLYEVTGENVFPTRADRSFTVNKEKKNLTGEEYVEYATQKGQLSFDLLTKLTSSQAYKAMDDADKARAVSEAYSYANAVAKTKVSDYRPDGWIAKARECEEQYGIPVSTYIAAYSVTRGITSIEDENGDAVDNSKGLQIMEKVYGSKAVANLTAGQREKLFADLGVGGSVCYYTAKQVEQSLEIMRKNAG